MNNNLKPLQEGDLQENRVFPGEDLRGPEDGGCSRNELKMNRR